MMSQLLAAKIHNIKELQDLVSVQIDGKNLGNIAIGTSPTHLPSCC